MIKNPLSILQGKPAGDKLIQTASNEQNHLNLAQKLLVQPQSKAKYYRINTLGQTIADMLDTAKSQKKEFSPLKKAQLVNISSKNTKMYSEIPNISHKITLILPSLIHF